MTNGPPFVLSAVFPLEGNLVAPFERAPSRSAAQGTNGYSEQETAGAVEASGHEFAAVHESDVDGVDGSSTGTGVRWMLGC